MSSTPCCFLFVYSQDSCVFFFFADHHFSMHWFLLLLHSLAAFLSFFLSFFHVVFSFWQYFLETRASRPYQLHSQKFNNPAPLGAMDEFTSGTTCNGCNWSKWYGDFWDPKKANCGYLLGCNSSQIWIGVGAWKQFVELWGANIVCVRLMYSCNY